MLAFSLNAIDREIVVEGEEAEVTSFTIGREVATRSWSGVSGIFFFSA